jgi:hypothetical protein
MTEKKMNAAAVTANETAAAKAPAAKAPAAKSAKAAKAVKARNTSGVVAKALGIEHATPAVVSAASELNNAAVLTVGAIKMLATQVILGTAGKALDSRRRIVPAPVLTLAGVESVCNFLNRVPLASAVRSGFFEFMRQHGVVVSFAKDERGKPAALASGKANRDAVQSAAAACKNPEISIKGYISDETKKARAEKAKNTVKAGPYDSILSTLDTQYEKAKEQHKKYAELVLGNKAAAERYAPDLEYYAQREQILCDIRAYVNQMKANAKYLHITK